MSLVMINAECSSQKAEVSGKRAEVPSDFCLLPSDLCLWMRYISHLQEERPMTAIETKATPKYPDVRNYIGGEVVAGNGGPPLPRKKTAPRRGLPPGPPCARGRP